MHTHDLSALFAEHLAQREGQVSPLQFAIDKLNAEAYPDVFRTISGYSCRPRLPSRDCIREWLHHDWVGVRDGFGVSRTTVVGESIWRASICDYIPAQDEPDAVSWLAERVGITLKWLRESPLWHIRQERSIYEFDCELLWSFCRGHWPVPICGALW